MAKKSDNLQDFGEKIGGARKDLAVKKGPREPKGEVDTRPGWMKRYQVSEVVADSNSKLSPAMRSYYGYADDTGKFVINDLRTKDWQGNPKRATKQTFATRAEAERAVPMLAVSQKHFVRSNVVRDSEGKIDASKSTYEIWRKVTDKKQVKAAPLQFGTREEAMGYMAQNAAKLLTEGKGFGEEIRPKPEKVYRHGPETRSGDIDPKKFLSEFGFRGVEFGNWQGDRQKVVDHAYDAMRDLAEVTGFSTDVVGNRLGLGFGSRGHGGKNAAAAHYEPGKKAINLTKLSGAGTLAHEWWHATDHMLGNMHMPASAAKPITTGYESSTYASHMTTAKGSLHPKVVEAYKEVMDTIYHKHEERAIDTSMLERRAESSRKNLQSHIKSLRDDLTRSLDYKKRGGQPATEAQLKRFDELADKLVKGEAEPLKHQWNDPNGPSRRNMAGRWTNPTLEALNAIHKEVRGASAFGSNNTGSMNYIGGSFNAMRGVLDQIEAAKANPTEVVKKPTDYFTAAKNLDEARSESYWTTKHEMSARAFEAYVFDKLKESGRRSDYLVYGVSNNQYQHVGDNVHPYPGGEERTRINAAFDKLMAAMRETGTVKPAEHIGVRGWSDKAREASLAVRQANAVTKAAEVTNAVTPKAKTVTETPKTPKTEAPLPTISKVHPPEHILSRAAELGASGFKNGLGVAPALNAELNNLMFKGEGQPYDKSKIMDAYTKAWMQANIAEPVPGVTDKATIAKVKAEQDARFEKNLADNKAKAEAMKAKAAVKQPDMFGGASVKDQIKAASEAKAAKGRVGEPMTEGLFGSGMKQMDLVDMAKSAPAPVKAPAATTPSVPAPYKPQVGDAVHAKNAPAPWKIEKLDGNAAEVRKFNPSTRKWSAKTFSVDAGKIIGKAEKFGMAGMIAAPMAAALVAYDSTSRTASAAGKDGTHSTVDATKAALVAGGSTAAIMAGVGKAISLGVKVAAAAGPTVGKVAARAVPGLGVGMMALGAYEGYQRHGVAGALLGTVGADAVLDIPKAPVVGGGKGRAAGFAKANSTYTAMQSTKSNASSGGPSLRGWANPTVQAAAQAAKGRTFSGFKG